MDSGWLKILDVGAPRAGLIATTCLLVTLSHQNEWLGLEKLPDGAVLATSVAFLFFGLIFLFWALACLLKWTVQRIRKAAAEAEHQRNFLGKLSETWQTLAADEAEIFFGMIAREQRSNVFDLGFFRGNDAARGLLQRGLLQVDASYGSDRFMLKIPEQIWSRREELRPVAEDAVRQLAELKRTSGSHGSF